MENNDQPEKIRCMYVPPNSSLPCRVVLAPIDIERSQVINGVMEYRCCHHRTDVEMKDCPMCGTPIILPRYNRHVSKVCPHLDRLRAEEELPTYCPGLNNHCYAEPEPVTSTPDQTNGKGNEEDVDAKTEGSTEKRSKSDKKYEEIGESTESRFATGVQRWKLLTTTEGEAHLKRVTAERLQAIRQLIDSTYEHCATLFGCEGLQSDLIMSSDERSCNNVVINDENASAMTDSHEGGSEDHTKNHGRNLLRKHDQENDERKVLSDTVAMLPTHAPRIVLQQNNSTNVSNACSVENVKTSRQYGQREDETKTQEQGNGNDKAVNDKVDLQHDGLIDCLKQCYMESHRRYHQAKKITCKEGQQEDDTHSGEAGQGGISDVAHEDGSAFIGYSGIVELGCGKAGLLRAISEAMLGHQAKLKQRGNVSGMSQEVNLPTTQESATTAITSNITPTPSATLTDDSSHATSPTHLAPTPYPCIFAAVDQETFHCSQDRYIKEIIGHTTFTPLSSAPTSSDTSKSDGDQGDLRDGKNSQKTRLRNVREIVKEERLSILYAGKPIPPSLRSYIPSTTPPISPPSSLPKLTSHTFLRLAHDIRDFALAALPLPTPSQSSQFQSPPPSLPVAVVAKHLCGGATDSAIRCALNARLGMIQNRRIGEEEKGEKGDKETRMVEGEGNMTENSQTNQPSQQQKEQLQGKKRDWYHRDKAIETIQGPPLSIECMLIATCCHHRCTWSSFLSMSLL